MVEKIRSVLFFASFILPITSLLPVAVCAGYECSFLSTETIVAGNLADPLLSEIYTKDFLSSMAESAVLQNINSSMLGGKIIEKNRMSLGYGGGRNQIKPRDFYFQFTELHELPTQGIAASPSLSYAVNLGHAFEKAGEWRKWNLHSQFFPYYLSEKNIPFLKVRNTEVDGRVANLSLNLRYFPFLDQSGNTKGVSFGFGLYHTNQEVSLHAYDRRPTQIRLDGDKRRWLGTSSLDYESKILSSTADLRYSFEIAKMTLYTGLGMMYNHGMTSIKAERVAIISSYLSPDDFLTNPSGIALNVTKELKIREANFYGIFGAQYHWESFGIGIEYLKNIKTESLNVGVHYYF